MTKCTHKSNLCSGSRKPGMNKFKCSKCLHFQFDQNLDVRMNWQDVKSIENLPDTFKFFWGKGSSCRQWQGYSTDGFTWRDTAQVLEKACPCHGVKWAIGQHAANDHTDVKDRVALNLLQRIRRKKKKIEADNIMEKMREPAKKMKGETKRQETEREKGEERRKEGSEVREKEMREGMLRNTHPNVTFSWKEALRYSHCIDQRTNNVWSSHENQVGDVKGLVGTLPAIDPNQVTAWHGTEQPYEKRKESEQLSKHLPGDTRKAFQKIKKEWAKQ